MDNNYLKNAKVTLAIYINVVKQFFIYVALLISFYYKLFVDNNCLLAELNYIQYSVK